MSRRVWIAVVAAIMVAVAVVAFVAYGGVRSSGTPREQLKTWVSNTGLGQDLGALHDDGLDVDKVVSRDKGTTAVHTVCSVLSVTAELAHSNLPSPDTHITQLLARAYILEYDAGNNCYAAGATNTKLLAKSATERNKAEAIIADVLDQIGGLTGKSVATTTTTEASTTTEIFG